MSPIDPSRPPPDEHFAWERAPDESNSDFGQFQTYLDLPRHERTVAGAWRQWTGRLTDTPPGSICETAVRRHWKARAIARDNHIDRRAHAALQAERTTTLRRVFDVGDAMLRRAIEGLERLRVTEGMVLSADEIARFANVGSELAAMALGMPTARTALVGAEDDAATEALTGAKQELQRRLDAIVERQALANRLLASGPEQPTVVRDDGVIDEDCVVEGPTADEMAAKHDRQRERGPAVQVQRVSGSPAFDGWVGAHRLR